MVQTLIFLAIGMQIQPIGPVPDSLKLDPFYKKYIDVDGIPLVSSSKPPDAALREAARLAHEMLKGLDAERKAMIAKKLRIAVMAESEQTTDIPEHSDLNRVFPQTDWNKRARGLGPTLERPTISCAEENLLQYKSDRYRGESIFIHEFAHAIMEFGLETTHPSFRNELEQLRLSAIARGLWKGTYAASNTNEFWAESVQDWFDCNLTASPPNGNHNEIGTRAALMQYDPDTAKFVGRYLRTDEWRWKPIPGVADKSQT